MTTNTYLTLRSVAKSFGVKGVLRGVDLEIRRGEFVAVVGKSGSGKSTLLRLLAGLETPDEGEICIGNRPLRGSNVEARVMFQDARLLPWKHIVNNVGLGLRGNWKDQALEALDHVGLADRAGEYPAVLSGGERQRVALARALITRPPLLLLDEPLGALDALTRIEMQQLVERLWLEQRFTALLITHDVEEAIALADRVVLLEDGIIALDVEVSLPRPRARASVEFAELKDLILKRVLNQRAAEVHAAYECPQVIETPAPVWAS